MAAERETVDRLIASPPRRPGRRDLRGAHCRRDALGPVRAAPRDRRRRLRADRHARDEFYHHVEAAHALVGARTGEAYRLGDEVEVRLVEAIPSAGALRFEMLSQGRRDSDAVNVKGLRAQRRTSTRRSFGARR